MAFVEAGHADDEAIVRLWRWDADRLRIDAIADQRDRADDGADAIASISAFAMPFGPDRSREVAEEMALAAALAERSANWVTFTSRSRLEAAGFEVFHDEPPPCHVGVRIADVEDDEELLRLESVFNERERRKP
ncbi:hypothetical protein [Agrococcus sp. KRD186]|uniref:hypothetical protein n=1 Tax=Agrococcus sp. KRD186 TaxID=2729730 RepID=UPI0019D2273E|nr:hypothetical protein [Agrococcus sp. KRD186]